MLVFVVGLLAIIVMMVKQVKGAILIGIVGATVLAIIIEKIADIGPSFTPPDKVNPHGWGLNVPAIPDKIFDKPDFGLLGHFSLFGSFERVGFVTAVLFAFTLLLADFFDTLGTMTAIGAEAGLLDEEGNPPNTQRILLVDSLAAAAGGAASVSSNTSYIESAAGVGEGRARASRAGHRGAVPARDLPRATRLDRALRGRDARTRRRRLPDDGAGPGASTGTTGRSPSRRS